MNLELKNVLRPKKHHVVRIEKGLIERLRESESQALTEIVKNALELCYIIRMKNERSKNDRD